MKMDKTALLQQLQVEPLRRFFTVQRNTLDAEKRTVELSASSEEAVERYFGLEILDHAPNSVDLDFLASGRAPFLLGHQSDQQIGVVDSAILDASARRLRATVRFGKSALAEEMFQDVRDGIRQNISIGYIIRDLVLQEDHDDAPPVYRVTRWTPLEISLVPIPADPSVGIGRAKASLGDQSLVATPLSPSKEGEPRMEEKDKLTEDQLRQQITADLQKRQKEIIDLGLKHARRDLALSAVASGLTLEQFRGQLLESLGDGKPLETPVDTIGLNQRQTQEFSLVRAIAALAQRDWSLAPFERDCSVAVAKQLKKDPQGFFVPHEVRAAWQKRDLTAGVATAGGYTVGTQLLGLIELLRNKMTVVTLGARILSDLVGDVAFSKQTGGATAYWVAENGSVTESNQTFGQVLMTPKTVGAMTDISRKLLVQSSLDIEGLVRDDLATVLAIAIDLAAINGLGAAGQPRGILNTTGIGSVSWATDNEPLFSEIVDIETEVAKDNALMQSLAYLTNATLRGYMKKTVKEAGQALYIWESGETPLNGYPAEVSEQVPTGTALFGNWADLLIGNWAGLDVLVDPYTGSAAGTVRVRVLQEVDVAVRHPESFCKGIN